MTTHLPLHDQQQGLPHDEIAQAAFRIFEKHGSQHGHDLRNWLDAEAHVRAKHGGSRHGKPTPVQVGGHPIH